MDPRRNKWLLQERVKESHFSGYEENTKQKKVWMGERPICEGNQIKNLLKEFHGKFGKFFFMLTVVTIMFAFATSCKLLEMSTSPVTSMTLQVRNSKK